ncbi:hypothetical protein ACWDBD_43075 [Streptomyces sp. NPDC001118]
MSDAIEKAARDAIEAADNTDMVKQIAAILAAQQLLNVQQQPAACHHQQAQPFDAKKWLVIGGVVVSVSLVGTRLCLAVMDWRANNNVLVPAPTSEACAPPTSASTSRELASSPAAVKASPFGPRSSSRPRLRTSPPAPRPRTPHRRRHPVRAVRRRPGRGAEC